VDEFTGRIQRRPDPLFSRLDDELLGLNTQAGLAYSLNRSAGRVWELIESWTTVEAVCVQIEQEYDVDHPTCARHVTELLEKLRESELIDVDPVLA
jgi:hypothetical protein